MDVHITDRRSEIQPGLPFPKPWPKVVTGMTVAYQLRGKGKVARAVIGADLADAEWLLEKPTHRQIARICGVNETYLNRVLALSQHERQLAAWTGVLPPAHADVVRTITRCGVEDAFDVITTLI